ncbi:hypothetical protein BDF19DRAFT_414609 [Syncephalis fuscata]|nr:hypothetical protein BDF19DRAFT_414609 [Syncephalis fuscata]
MNRLVALVLLITWQIIAPFHTCCLAQPPSAFLTFHKNDKLSRYQIFDSFYGNPMPYDLEGSLFYTMLRGRDCEFHTTPRNLTPSNSFFKRTNQTEIILVVNQEEAEFAGCVPLSRITDAILKFNDDTEITTHPKVNGALIILKSETRPSFNLSPEVGPIALLPSVHAPEVKKHFENSSYLINLRLSQPANPTDLRQSIDEYTTSQCIILLINAFMTIPVIINIFLLIKHGNFHISKRNLVVVLGILSSMFMSFSEIGYYLPFLSSVFNKISHIFFITAFFLLLQLWCLAIAGVRGTPPSNNLKYMLYMGSQIFIIAQSIELVYWFQMDYAGRYWIRIINLYVNLTIYLVIGPSFAYQGKIFLRMKQNNHLSASTRQALVSMTRTSIICYVAFVLRIANEILSDVRTEAPNSFLILLQGFLSDVSDLTGLFAILWSLGPDGQNNQSPCSYLCQLLTASPLYKSCIAIFKKPDTELV